MKQLLQLLLIHVLVASCTKKQDLEIKLKLDSIQYKSLDSAYIKIKFSNNTEESLAIPIENPVSYTGGLWYSFNFKLTDNNGKNVLYCGNNSILSSVELTNIKDHKENFDTIPAFSSISKKYKLRKLISPKTDKLKSGEYKLYLNYEDINSNEVLLKIKN